MTQINLQSVSLGATPALMTAAVMWQARQAVLALWRRKRTMQMGQQDLNERISTLKVEVAQLREEMVMLKKVEAGETVDLFAGINSALDMFQKTENVSRRAAARMVKAQVCKALRSAENDLNKVKDIQHVRVQEAKARQQLREERMANQRLLDEATAVVVELHQQQARDMALAVKSVNIVARQRVDARMDEIKVAEAALEALKERLSNDNVTD